MSTDFSVYVRDVYPKFQLLIKRSLESNTRMLVFERLALKIMCALEHGIIELPSSEIGCVYRDLCKRMVQELFCAIGSLRAGSMNGILHTCRSLIELHASARHLLIGNENENEKRLKRYFEFSPLLLYQHYIKLKLLKDANKISELEFEQTCLARPVDIDGWTEEKIRYWENLWGSKKPKKVDLLTIKFWHYPRTILDLLENQNAEMSIYESLCHGVHVSPVSRAVGGHAMVISPSDMLQVDRNIDLAVQFVFKLTETLDEALGGQKFFDELAPVFINWGLATPKV